MLIDGTIILSDAETTETFLVQLNAGGQWLAEDPSFYPNRPVGHGETTTARVDLVTHSRGEPSTDDTREWEPLMWRPVLRSDAERVLDMIGLRLLSRLSA